MAETLQAVLERQLLDDTDPALDHFQDDFYGDFYDFFANYQNFKMLTGQLTPADLKKLKLYLYLDIFNSVDFRGRKTYRYCLVFDHELNFLAAESDFTLSALIRDLRKTPDRVSDYEQVKQQVLEGLAERFQSAASDGNQRIQNFNEVVADIYDKYSLNRYKIAYSLK